MGRGALYVLAAAAGLAALSAGAQPAGELEELKQEAARMRQSLDTLDARIRALEAEHGASSPSTRPSSAPGVAFRDAGSSYALLLRSWSEIQPGTPKTRVDALLGAPERVMHINGDLVWYYVYPGIGRGSVFFTREETVSAVQPPRSGWSW